MSKNQPQKTINVRPIAAAVPLVVAALSVGVLAGTHLPRPTAPVPAASSQYPSQTIADLVNPPGLSQTKRPVISPNEDQGTRPERVALSPRQRLDLQQQLIDARCLLAGGEAEGQTPETRCTVELPALPAIPRGR